MNDHNSTVEALRKFANRTGREFDYTETPYPSAMMHKVTYHRRTIYIPDGNKSFVCFADSKEMGPQALFSGVFVPFEASTSTRVVIRKKDIIDKLNPFGKKKTCNTGIPGFDSLVRITSNEPAFVKRIFQDRNIQNLVSDAFKLNEVIIIGINDLDLGFIPTFKGTSHLGIYTQQEWIVDGKMIEKLFHLIESK